MSEFFKEIFLMKIVETIFVNSFFSETLVVSGEAQLIAFFTL